MMDRRNFLGAGATALAALAAPKLLRGQSCDNLTQTDKYGLGPFYTAGAPMRTKLAGDYEPGQKIAIQGTVTNCAGPVSGVNLDVWHATESGCYKHPDDTCPDIPGHPDTFRLRGQMVTDAQGKYAFTTVKPGAYLNGDQYRPSHIHAIISSPAIKNLHIVTQLYFAGDPYIKGDYAADDPSATNRIIPLEQNAQAPWEGTWNIRIPGGTSGIDPLSDPAIANFDVVMQRRGSELLFHLPPNTSKQPVEMRLYDFSGRLLKRSLHTVTPVELDASLLASGAYVIELGWWTNKGLRTESVPFHI
jgi:protocatechuate 3,4-dioxygenase beta subunit